MRTFLLMMFLATGCGTPRLVWQEQRGVGSILQSRVWGKLVGDPPAVYSPSRAEQPTLDAAGDRYVFTRTALTPEIWVADIGGHNPRSLPAAGGVLTGRNATWHPDGHRIVYLTVGTSEGNIAVYDMRTQTSTVLTTTGRYTDPSVSPDGDRIAYSRENRVYVMEIDGTNARPVTAGSQPAWSRDGEMLAFIDQVTVDRRTTWQVFVVNVNGTDRRRVTSFPASSFFPAFSPDGLRIAFTHLPDGRETSWNVYWILVVGGTALPLTDNKGDGFLSHPSFTRSP